MAKAGTKNSIIFLSFFVVQQMVSFLFLTAKLVSVYWAFIYLLIGIVAVKLPLFDKKYKPALFFSILVIMTCMPSYLIKGEIGYLAQNSVFLLVGYVGYIYMCEKKKFDLSVFNVLFVVLYLFFYLVYFRYKEFLVETVEEGDLFGHSSSNSIPACLNLLLFFYYYIYNYVNEKKTSYHKRCLLFFASINLILIFIQASRAGLLGAVSLFAIIIYDTLIKGGKYKYLFFIFIALILFYLLSKNYDSLLLYSEQTGIDKALDNYEEEERGAALFSFFYNLDSYHFLWGYRADYEFLFDIYRTFNTYIDIWSYYGFATFVIFVFMTLYRIISFKHYSTPLYVFLPIFLYCIFESFLANGLWSIIWYIAFFHNRIESVDISKPVVRRKHYAVQY